MHTKRPVSPEVVCGSACQVSLPQVWSLGVVCVVLDEVALADALGNATCELMACRPLKQFRASLSLSLWN